MPMYSYECDECNLISEAIVKIELRDSLKCGICNKTMQRMIDPPRAVYSITTGRGLS